MSGVTGYAVEISQNPNFTDQVTSYPAIKTTNMVVPNPQMATTYYWRVRGSRRLRRSSPSGRRSSTTQVQDLPSADPGGPGDRRHRRRRRRPGLEPDQRREDLPAADLAPTRTSTPSSTRSPAITGTTLRAARDAEQRPVLLAGARRRRHRRRPELGRPADLAVPARLARPAAPGLPGRTEPASATRSTSSGLRRPWPTATPSRSARPPDSRRRTPRRRATTVNTTFTPDADSHPCMPARQRHLLLAGLRSRRRRRHRPARCRRAHVHLQPGHGSP